MIILAKQVIDRVGGAQHRVAEGAQYRVAEGAKRRVSIRCRSERAKARAGFLKIIDLFIWMCARHLNNGADIT